MGADRTNHYLRFTYLCERSRTSVMDRNVNMNIHPIDVDTLCGNREEVATMDKERSRVLGESPQGFPAERDESEDSCVGGWVPRAGPGPPLSG